jgi:hypothetical protein
MQHGKFKGPRWIARNFNYQHSKCNDDRGASEMEAAWVIYDTLDMILFGLAVSFGVILLQALSLVVAQRSHATPGKRILTRLIFTIEVIWTIQSALLGKVFVSVDRISSWQTMGSTKFWPTVPASVQSWLGKIYIYVSSLALCLTEARRLGWTLGWSHWG